jgi:hypothetical protein
MKKSATAFALAGQTATFGRVPGRAAPAPNPPSSSSPSPGMQSSPTSPNTYPGSAGPGSSNPSNQGRANRDIAGVTIRITKRCPLLPKKGAGVAERLAEIGGR